LICGRCGGGGVVWKGPLSNLTHTECPDCGARNSQVVEDDRSDLEDDEGED